nr:unnamed protein product [Callosobruchus analis]
MRVRIDKEQDFKILEKVARRYHFNLLDEQVEDLDNTRVEGGKRKLYLQPPTLLVDDTDDDDDAADADANDASRLGSHQAKRNKGDGEGAAAAAAAATASTSRAAAAAAAPPRVGNSSSRDDAVVLSLDEEFDFPVEK